MHVSRRGIDRLLLLAVAVAAIGVSGAQAGSKPEANADPTAIHSKHEDAVYGSSQRTTQAQTTAAQLRAAHWKHEDALYRARDSSSGSRSATTDLVAARDGIGWGEMLGGAGGVLALIIVGGGATIVLRRRHGGLAQS